MLAQISIFGGRTKSNLIKINILRRSLGQIWEQRSSFPNSRRLDRCFFPSKQKDEAIKIFAIYWLKGISLFYLQRHLFIYNLVLSLFFVPPAVSEVAFFFFFLLLLVHNCEKHFSESQNAAWREAGKYVYFCTRQTLLLQQRLQLRLWYPACAWEGELDVWKWFHVHEQKTGNLNPQRLQQKKKKLKTLKTVKQSRGLL